jgi:hypothetical protein
MCQRFPPFWGQGRRVVPVYSLVYTLQSWLSVPWGLSHSSEEEICNIVQKIYLQFTWRLLLGARWSFPFLDHKPSTFSSWHLLNEIPDILSHLIFTTTLLWTFIKRKQRLREVSCCGSLSSEWWNWNLAVNRAYKTQDFWPHQWSDS